MFMGALPAVCVDHMLPGVPGGQERVRDLLGARLTDGCEPQFVCWESNWGPLEETASAKPLTRL